MKKFTNFEIARLLRNVAVSYQLKDEKKYRFQIIAYNKAADAIEVSPVQLQDIYLEEEKLDKISGVGPSIAAHIQELFNKGRVDHFQDIMKGVPEAIFPLLDVPNFGPKKAYKIVSIFKLSDPDTVTEEVEKLANSGRIAELEGFGKKSEEDLLTGITQFKEGKTKSNRMALPFAHAIGEQIVDYLKKNPKVKRVEMLGSLRRMRDTIGDVDLAVASNDAGNVIDYFVKYPRIERLIEKGPVSASFVANGGAQIDLMVQSEKRFGALLQHFTGSKQHNVALRERAVRSGFSLSERGIKEVKSGRLHEFANEKDFYKFLGLPYIEPELREDRGEIDAALRQAQGKFPGLPKLIEVTDIKGDLHTHTNFNIEPSHDLGKNSMQEMTEKARSMGYEYIGFADHNPSTSGHNADDITKLIKKRGKEIEHLNESNKDVRVYNLLEIDILPNGDLPLNNEQLNMLEGAIVSLHSAFTQDREKITQRILKGLSHPKVRIFGHPTGRLINSRAGADADWDSIFSFCRQEDIALEINSASQRLDLSDVMVKRAIEAGCRVIIDTDSHSVEGFSMMKYGVAVARRGWCEKRNVVNTLPGKEFEKWMLK